MVPKKKGISSAFDCGELSHEPGFEAGVKRMQDGLCTAACTEDGWTVIQSRGQFGNPETFFKRDWRQFSKGFGTAGNDKIHVIQKR